MEQELICSICGVKVKYFTNIEQFIKGEGRGWHGTISSRNEKSYEFWYCPAHSMEKTIEFEKEAMHKLGLEY
jgi:hypothetical protein